MVMIDGWTSVWINAIPSCGFETSCKKMGPGHNPAIDMWALVVLECSKGSWGRSGQEGVKVLI